MQFDITWTITAIIAVSSFISPIIVAIINNRHHTKIRKLELSHDEQIRKFDLQQQASVRQCDIYYADKRQAFLDFLEAAGNFSVKRGSNSHYEILQSTIQRALLFCNSDNQHRLHDFLSYVDESVYGSTHTKTERTTYSNTLIEIAVHLNEELESTKPVIQSE